MKQTKLIKLLSLLSAKELQKLRAFTKSDYFNKDEKIINLIAYLSKKVPDFEVTKQACYKAAFKDNVLNDSALRRLFSKTLKLVEQFVWIEQGRKKEDVQHQLLTKFCMERDAKEDVFETYAKTWEQSIDLLSWDDQVIQKFILVRNKSTFRRNERNKNVFVYNSKQKYIDVIDEYMTVLEEMLIRIISDAGVKYLVTQTNPIKEDVSNPNRLIFKLQKYIIGQEEMIMKQWKDKPMVLQGLLSYKLLKDLNPDHYLYLKEMVINDLNIPSTNQEQILTDLIIYLYFLNKTNPQIECDKEEFEIYNILIDRELIFRQGKILPVIFYNVVSIAKDLGHIIWAEQFILTYKDKLPEEHKFHITEACWAMMALRQKKIIKALKHFDNLKNARSYMYNIQMRQKEVRAYYEINDFRLEPALQSLKVMLSRSDKHALDMRYRNKIFVNLLLRLINIPPSKKEKLQQLKIEIKDSDTNCKRWLIKKIDAKLDNIKDSHFPK